ncbi:helix-turn-helix transcriptional regulator [Marivibrio halodurans]|uniref:Helix-turn-helix transcriptional regulator n=1 Tax=Marivibrio halodurans TaxID=2039722 RepID=A0A8J7SPD3_9PROT|nr:helix-turn-helix transcriptional regulator [Marivibrio halodurans]MBP5858276.1 helix-turn-helix transcriptional regulator [Marivibrio halodurans]
MDNKNATAAFKALAQPTRLLAFRAVVRAGTSGIAPGFLAERMGVPHNTLSGHLDILRRAGLIRLAEQGGGRRYAVDPSGMRALGDYLLADCCGGRPDICAAVLPSLHGERKGAE